MPTTKFRVFYLAVFLGLSPHCVLAENVDSKPEVKSSLPLTTFSQNEASRALNIGKLEEIQAGTVLYEAQLAMARALNELHKNGFDGTLERPFNPAPPSQDTQKLIKVTEEYSSPPQVVEITGSGNGFSAVLVLSNGNRVPVQNGSRVPGTEYTVKRVGFNEVVVSGKNNTLLSLSFAG